VDGEKAKRVNKANAEQKFQDSALVLLNKILEQNAPRDTVRLIAPGGTGIDWDEWDEKADSAIERSK